jgi:pimeloyl-ACP methyl ester carboxylesterase
MSTAKPLPIAVPQAVLDDVRERLLRTRWPIEPKVPAWTYGTSLEWMREVATHWIERYDWRPWEARLNKAGRSQQVEIDGKRVHLLIEAGSGPTPMPLLMTHGWPGSVVEFLDVIEPLAHPERFGGDITDAFTVIAPSLPGYGFSDPPDAPRSHREVGTLWHRVMTEALGYRRYAVQGGDVGAMVSSWLALDFPDDVLALHLNFVPFQPSLDGAAPLDDAERTWQTAALARREGETGYQQIQGTKFQTLSYGLTDSPIGLAAWILEKFQGWTVPGSGRPPPFDMDHLITNVMMHWLGGPNAPMWTYKFVIDGAQRRLPPGRSVTVPTGVLLCPQDLSVPPPSQWIRRSYNLVHRTDAAEGGHFAALQLGPLFVDDVRTFFRAFRAAK